MDVQRFVVSLGGIVLSEAGRLVRIPLVILGRWAKGLQTFAITRADVTAIAENFRKRMNGELVIDYEHASERPEIAAGGPVPAAGWLREIEDTPDENGVLWGLAEFTERARALIAAAEYKYLSPALNWGARDGRTGEQQGCTLTSMALTNRPVLTAMPAITLSEAGWVSEETTGGPMEKSIFTDYRKLDEWLCNEAQARQKAKGLSFRDALLQVARENPAIMRLREELYMEGARSASQLKTYKVVGDHLVELESQIEQLTREAMERHPGLNYGQALKVTASEHPELFRTREQFMRFLHE
jgi:phage I-like protein